MHVVYRTIKLGAQAQNWLIGLSLLSATALKYANAAWEMTVAWITANQPLTIGLGLGAFILVVVAGCLYLTVVDQCDSLVRDP